MQIKEGDFLRSSMRSNFSNLAKDQKINSIHDQNIGLTTYGLTLEEADAVFEQAKTLGFSPMRIRDIAKSIAIVIQQDNLTLPQGKKHKNEKGRIVEQILERISFEKQEDASLHFKIRNSSEKDAAELDITNLLQENIEALEPVIQDITTDSASIGRIINYISRHIANNSALALEQNSPGQFEFNGSRIILVHDESTSVTNRKKADSAITVGDKNKARFGILRETTRFAQIDKQRRELSKKFNDREIQVIPKFSIHNWPTDPLMSHLRQLIAKETDKYCISNNLLCDSKDLKYQTLFRLTTFDVPDLFENGQLLEEYLINAGAYSNWRNILTLNSEFIKSFSLNNQIVTNVINEQYKIIKARLQPSDLPLEQILVPQGIFSEAGWVIQRRNSKIAAVQEDTASSISDEVPLDFREIDPKEAIRIHRDLHYIHTPRADMAFGLYVQGENIPFSVLAIEKIDRAYKENALIFQGYDPEKCFDLTRLYSKPGTPGNTSSSMFTLTFQFLKNNFPDTQAILSSFMPSYATGISMTSGGFDDPVIVKPLSHKFVERDIDDSKCYEHVTNRRLGDINGKIIRSRLPLLPTVELMTTLRPPRYTPLPGADKYMLEIY